MASKTTNDHFYSEQQKKWLRENIKRLRYKDLVRAFNDTFALDISYDALTSYCLKTLKIKRGKENQYGFSKGKQTTKHTLKIGSEVWDGMTLWIKVSDDVVTEQRICGAKRSNPNWKPKKEIVWERHYGTIPDGMLIVHLNKDGKDCSLDNLYLVNRQVNFMMAKNGWYSENKEFTKAALKWCELFYALKNQERMCRK